MPHEQPPPLDPDPLSPYVAWAGGRNRDPILDVLRTELPQASSHVLEIDSGSGMHINYFAPYFPATRFQPSDRIDRTFHRIRELREEGRCTNVDDPIVLDLTDETTWPAGNDRRFDAIFCINIFQVAPVRIADGMMSCAVQVLTPGGQLMIYGPFKVEGAYTTQSNQDFDAKLRSAGVAEWGLKDVLDLDASAEAAGLAPGKRIDMPANNLFLTYAVS
jgi:hypothetical protein